MNENTMDLEIMNILLNPCNLDTARARFFSCWQGFVQGCDFDSNFEVNIFQFLKVATNETSKMYLALSNVYMDSA